MKSSSWSTLRSRSRHMNIEQIIQAKPHLRDALRLYERILAFLSVATEMGRGKIRFEDVTYPPELVEPLLDAFSSVFDVPEETLVPLREAMQFGRFDLTRLPLGEVPGFGLPYHEDELRMILFFLARPYFTLLRDLHNLDSTAWEEGRCPLCNAQPSMAMLDAEGKRHLHCAYCGTTGPYRRLGCPFCLVDDASRIDIISVEGEHGLRIDACSVCNSYIKTAIGQSPDLDLSDLISMPLDIVAQERGFSRPSPNPVGMIRIV